MGNLAEILIDFVWLCTICLGVSINIVLQPALLAQLQDEASKYQVPVFRMPKLPNK